MVRLLWNRRLARHTLHNAVLSRCESHDPGGGGVSTMMKSAESAPKFARVQGSNLILCLVEHCKTGCGFGMGQ